MSDRSAKFSIHLSGGKFSATIPIKDFKDAVEALEPSYARSFLTSLLTQALSEKSPDQLNAVLASGSPQGKILIEAWVSNHASHLQGMSQQLSAPTKHQKNEGVDILNRRRALTWALGASLAGAGGATARVSGNTAMALFLEPSAICVIAGCLRDYSKAQRFLTAVADINASIGDSYARLYGQQLSMPPSLSSVPSHQGRSR